MHNLAKLQDQLSLVSNYTTQVHRQMEVLGDAYTKSKTFISDLGAIALLMDSLRDEINSMFDREEEL